MAKNKTWLDKCKGNKRHIDIYSILTKEQIAEAQKELDKYILEMMKRY